MQPYPTYMEVIMTGLADVGHGAEQPEQDFPIHPEHIRDMEIQKG